MHSIHILSLELIAGNIKHNKIRKLFFYGKTGCLRHMGLAQTGTAEDKQRIERRFTRSACYIFRRIGSKAVAVPHYKILEAVYGIEARVHLNLGDAGEYERTRVARRLPSAHAYALIYGRIARALRIAHGLLALDRADDIHEPCSSAQFFFKRGLDYIKESAFEIFAEEL